ncbi:hypothetical protein [Staphylococcus xylosus]|uniref:hypothetical protein n=1 Tax=Staphylococcus xylosus TaxID=1288 RepID=UPI003F5555F4
MPEKVVQEYKNSDWNITEKGAYRDVNLSEGDVYINGKNHEINNRYIVKVDNMKNEIELLLLVIMEKNRNF